MASARKMTPAQQVAVSTQEILQVSITALWCATDDKFVGRGPLALLCEELRVGADTARRYCDALEFVGLLERTKKRGRGAYFLVKKATITQPPTVTLKQARRALKGVDGPIVKLRVA